MAGHHHRGTAVAVFIGVAGWICAGASSFAVAQELAHFVVAHPIVLVVVEHGHEDVEVTEKLMQRLRALQRKLDRIGFE